MKVRFSTILIGASISASRRKFPTKKKIILKESLWDQGIHYPVALMNDALNM